MRAKVLKFVLGFLLVNICIVLLGVGAYFLIQRKSIACWTEMVPGFRMGYSMRLDIPRPDVQLDQHAACMGTTRTTFYYSNIVQGVDEASYLFAHRKIYGY